MSETSMRFRATANARDLTELPNGQVEGKTVDGLRFIRSPSKHDKQTLADQRATVGAGRNVARVSRQPSRVAATAGA
jgi:hypothetical protein